MRERFGRWTDDLVWKILVHLPSVLIEQPERVLLKASLAVLGVAWLLISPTNAALTGLAPTLLRYMWCTYLIVGGVGTIVGMVRQYPTLEQIGLLSTALGCFLVAGTAFLLIPRGIVSAVVFTFVGVASAIRLLVTYGAKRTLRRLNEDYIS